MSRFAPRHPGRMFVSLASIVALVVGVPAALLAAARSRFGSGSPWHGVEPPWNWETSSIAEALGERLADDTLTDVIVRLALTTVWATLIVVVATTLAEIVHAHRHGLPVPRMRGLGWAQRIGHFIASGLIVAGPVATPLAAMATSQLATPRVEAAVAPSAPPIAGAVLERRGLDVPPASLGGSPGRDVVSAPEHTPARPVHVVAQGESVYSIAAVLAGGDPDRTEDIAMTIIDLNLGTEVATGQRFTNPAYIEPGWTLQLPDIGAHVETGHSAASAAGPRGTRMHIVETGDTLSSIAAEHLGDPAAWSEIWSENAGTEMPGGRTFDDPHLILPGWQLDVPGADVPAPRTTADDGPVEPAGTGAGETPDVTPDGSAPLSSGTDAAGDPVSAPRSPTSGPGAAVEVISSPAPRPPMTAMPSQASTPTASGGDTASTSPTADRGVAATTRSDTAANPVERSATADTTASTTTVMPGAGADEDTARPTDDDRPSAPAPIRLEHAAVLAAGILALVAVRRRTRLRTARPRSRVPDAHPDISATERRLRIIDSGERALRADVAMRAAAAHIMEEAAIGLVEISPEGEVALVLTAPANLPAPWEGESVRWSLPAAVPIELVSGSARQVGAPCLALVQLGTTERGNDLLVDLEACGTLAIDARPEQADEVVMALAAGLASSIHAEVAHLVGVSCPPEAFLGHRNTHRADDVDAALDLAASLIGSTLASERSSFEMRSRRAGGEMWEPAIVLLTAEDDADGAGLRPIPPGQGCAVVAVTGSAGLLGAPTRLCGRPDGWTLDAFGATVKVRPVGLDPTDLHEVAAVLDDATRLLLDEPRPCDGESDDPIDAAGSGAAHRADGGERRFVPRDHRLVVHLLDGVAIRSTDGDVGRFERSKTIELIAWLSTHRGRMTRSAARTALWELDVRDATFANVVSEARRGLARLVDPPDGEEWLARTLTDELPLHELVVTDAELIEERMAAARAQPPTEAIDTLRPAVALIEGMPFAGTSYLWPDAEGITSNILLTATGAATELAAHALAVGDTELVFWATGRALQVLPGHEELIGLRMRAHAHAGDLAAVRQEWESYERVIIADAWSDGEPASKLVELRHELLSSGS